MLTDKQKIQHFLLDLMKNIKLSKYINSSNLAKYYLGVCYSKHTIFIQWAYELEGENRASFIIEGLKSKTSAIPFKLQTASNNRIQSIYLDNSRDFKKILKEGVNSKDAIIRKAFNENLEYRIIEKMLSNFPSILKEIQASYVTEYNFPEIGGKAYSLFDLEDGNYIVINLSGKFYLIGHDLNQPILVASTPEEFIKSGSIEHVRSCFLKYTTK